MKTRLDDPVFSVSITSIAECLDEVSSVDKRLNRLEKHIQSPAFTSGKAGVEEQPESEPNKQPPNTVQSSESVQQSTSVYTVIEESPQPATCIDKPSPQNDSTALSGPCKLLTSIKGHNSVEK